MASDELKRRMLDDLWSGNKNLRERALLLVDSKVREKVREVAVVRQDTQLLREVMFADLRHAAKQLENNFDDQFYRRTAIRTLAASVDGMVFVILTSRSRTRIMRNNTQPDNLFDDNGRRDQATSHGKESHHTSEPQRNDSTVSHHRLGRGLVFSSGGGIGRLLRSRGQRRVWSEDFTASW
jgi:hypothetical protein